MPPLDGLRIALLESRKADDMAMLVQRLGGIPISVPSLREVPTRTDAAPILRDLAAGLFEVVVVLTGAAADALFTEAERLGVGDAVVGALGRATLACRGPKPLGVLRRRGLAVGVVTERPHTTAELLSALASVEIDQRRVLLLHYGERNDVVAEGLQERGAQVTELCLYEWALPEDLAPLRGLVSDIIGHRVDTVLFTSQVQLRHLLAVAREGGSEDTLVHALRDEVVVGAVGPVVGRALRAAGIIPDVMPAAPNGPSLLQAVADYHSIFGASGR